MVSKGLIEAAEENNETVVKTEIGTHACYICNKSIEEFELETHFLTHEDSSECKQDLNDVTASLTSKDKSHNKKQNVKKEKKCDVCNKTFLTKIDFNEHMNSHENKRNYNCDACGKNFMRKSSLIKHRLKVHENNGPHKCEFCLKEFNNTFSL